ncbi:XK-related protein 6 [Drosophila sulfurigaster albostrigata]|uniref:XK-related protein 6 n=1 Tax=Drosophila sulfurigaster albostrigata TaxID=89887 RepID=UPI002D21EA2E|nr:XK-related protein 6 [Drosophila sulfurigaster albostrigata]
MDFACGLRLDNVDSANVASYQITVFSSTLTVISALMRFITIILNWCLAYDYWISKSFAYCYWTILSIVLPMILTSMIYSTIMVITNVKNKPYNPWDHVRKLVLSYLFRDARTLNWALQYNEAKKHGDKVAQFQCYRGYLKEECNVGLLRLFDTFSETAPQKILQLAIVLRYIKTLTYFRAITFSIYFLSIAWGLVSYNRSNRLVQLDKHDIGTRGVIIQFWFLLCFSVSRTVCIAYVASQVPMETSIASIIQIILSATLVFVFDQPKFSKSAIMNYILCLAFGIVYLFIYTPVKDAPTKFKYLLYLTFCLLQNIILCIFYIPLYLSIAIIVLYLIGIALMIYYYLQCHPGITSSVF